jgi:hypothetical protein
VFWLVNLYSLLVYVYVCLYEYRGIEWEGKRLDLSFLVVLSELGRIYNRQAFIFFVSIGGSMPLLSVLSSCVFLLRLKCNVLSNRQLGWEVINLSGGENCKRRCSVYFCVTYFVKMTWERNRENCGGSSFTVEWAENVPYMAPGDIMCTVVVGKFMVISPVKK